MSVDRKPLLIYRLGSLGDTMVALPCFHAIMKAFAEQPRLVLTNIPVSSKAAPLEIILRPGGFIDGVIDYPVGVRSFRRLWELARAIRATKADTLVYLTPPRGLKAAWRDVLFFRACGLRTIIGAPTTQDLQDNRIDPQSGEEEPEAERLVRCLKASGPIDLADRGNWDLRLTADERAAGDAALAPLKGASFLAINMGGKIASKDWGDENWSALARRIASEFGGVGLVAVGGPEDAERSAAVLALWPGPVANLCGALLPRESAAALGRARAFVGHDSGPLHLAAAMGVPSLGLFGDNNVPRKWHPYGPANRVIHDVRGMNAIEVEQVSRAVLDIAGAGALA